METKANFIVHQYWFYESAYPFKTDTRFGYANTKSVDFANTASWCQPSKATKNLISQSFDPVPFLAICIYLVLPQTKSITSHSIPMVKTLSRPTLELDKRSTVRLVGTGIFLVDFRNLQTTSNRNEAVAAGSSKQEVFPARTLCKVDSRCVNNDNSWIGSTVSIPTLNQNHSSLIVTNSISNKFLPNLYTGNIA